MSYYELLKVAKNATLLEIEKAYRKAAITWHPDHQTDEKKVEASKHFASINEAYEVLKDHNKRFEYDQKGYVGRRRPSPPPPQRPKPQPKEEKKEKGPWDGRGEKAPVKNPPKEDLDAIECTFFGGYENGQGQHILKHLYLLPHELQFGCQTWVKIKRRDLCDAPGGCGGAGKIYEACSACKGRGEVSLGGGYFGICPKCFGENSEKAKTCHYCSGSGMRHWTADNVRLVVPPNTPIGQQLMVQGVGEPAFQRPPGNLRVVILEAVKEK